MPIKRSADVGNAIERLLVSENAQHEQLAFDLNVSTQMVSHMKNGRRPMQQDLAKESIRLYDNPEYIMDILYEFSSGFTSPVLRGKRIEQHRLALAEHVKREMRVALRLMEEGGLEDAPESLSTERKEAVEDIVNQLITLRVLEDNLLKQLQADYRISIKQRIQAMVVRWKAVGWL